MMTTLLLVVAASAAFTPHAVMRRTRIAAMSTASSDDEREGRAEILQRMRDLRQQGMTDEQILELIATEELAGTGIDIPAEAPCLPSAGQASWGTWSQDDGNIYLELYVEQGTGAKEVMCEVRDLQEKVGVLDVKVAGEPLLSGRLAHAVMSDIEWALDDSASGGQRVLCIDLEKRVKGTPDLAADALFEDLTVQGVEVSGQGLVSGLYADEIRRLTEEINEGSFGGGEP